MKFSFLITFYFTKAIVLIISLLGLPFKYTKFRFFVLFFTRNMTVILKLFGINIEVINSDFAHKKGYLYASKHQSMFETIYFNELFYNLSLIHI